MSSSGRTGPKGGKGAKADKSHKTDGGKGGGDKVHNKENHLSSKNEELSMKDKVKQLMELTCRSEDEVCLALHESDHDINTAINLLYEEPSTGEWETKDKKKKKRQTSAGGKTDKKGDEGGADDWDDVIPPAPSVGTGDGKDWKERGGRNNRNPSRSNNRGWREEGGRGRGGPRRGGPTRGRGGGRTGGRYPPRGGRGDGNRQQPIDTWDSSNTWDNSAATPAPPPVDDWDDFHTDEWSTEEYTGSLVETKVFTPSVQTPNDVFDSAQQPPQADTSSVNNVNANDTSYSQSLGGQNYQPTPSQPSPVPPMVGTLTAAQTQYFSQLSQQNSDTVGKQYVAASGTAYQAQTGVFDAKSNVQQTYSNSTQAQSYSTTAAQPYTQTTTNQSYATAQPTYAQPTYAQNSAFAYQEPQAQPQPQRSRTQRARVPPPSKIPASAVEMPGDLNNSSGVTYLDVQFGAMDLIDSSFDSSVAAVSLDNSTTTETDYGNVATSKNSTSISTALSQGLSNSDIPQQQPASEHLTYNNARNAAQSSTAPVEKQDSYSSQSAAGYNSYNNSKGGNNYAYATAQTTTSSYVNNPSVTSYGNNQYASSASYSNSYSSTTAQVYQNASYPVTQSNSYQNNPSSQSVYGANTGLSNNSNYSSAQYNSYNKLKDNSYDTSATSTTTALSQTTSVSKTTNKNPTSVMSNIPPGVTPVMSTPYIMGQMPYFQQHPAVYSFEDVQLLQQRMPHMTTPYYDMGYQTPTTLATVRGDPTATALGGYSATDARFQTAGRAGDGAASPVPPASQQQQQQQAPILTATPAPGAATPYFFAAAPYNTLGAPPNYAQFGTMYTQLPTVTNANNQYGPKPATYGSATGYGAYDALGQSAQDYSKASYAVGSAAAVAAAAAAQKNNSTSAGSGATDLSAMYGKTHAALGKVNSYEKQGFHSGTPPPFTGTLSQSAGGAAYAQQVYIPTMPQHHSTMAMHQPLHQMDVRHQGRRADSSGGAQRSQGSAGQAKAGSKQGYGASYWNQN